MCVQACSLPFVPSQWIECPPSYQTLVPSSVPWNPSCTPSPEPLSCNYPFLSLPLALSPSHIAVASTHAPLCRVENPPGDFCLPFSCHPSLFSFSNEPSNSLNPLPRLPVPLLPTPVRILSPTLHWKCSNQGHPGLPIAMFNGHFFVFLLLTLLTAFDEIEPLKHFLLLSSLTPHSQ